MSKGDFSNNGKDSFDESKQYIGIRLQQGVPLLDRDWNELEDIRRYFERVLRRHYIGDGVPDDTGFKISAPKFGNVDDFVIGAGRCMVNGYLVYNEKPIFFSAQPGNPTLPEGDVLIVYLAVKVERVDSTDDPDLLNSQDINLETCVRDRLSWRVYVTEYSKPPPVDAHVLAHIKRATGSSHITSGMILDKRRTRLNLSNVVDSFTQWKDRIEDLETDLNALRSEIEKIKKQLSRLFWDVDLEISARQALFCEKVKVTASVRDGLGEAVSGANLAFSTSWGSLSPSAAVTNSQGKATVYVTGVQAWTPPAVADLALLQATVQKVGAAAIDNPGVINYAKIKLEPKEMALVAKYVPPNALSDLSLDLPSAPIVARPPLQTATVTVHATESDGAIVRGVGSIQVHFGMWVHDWAKTKIWEVVSHVDVGMQVGNLMMEAAVENQFDPQKAKQMLPDVMQSIQDDTQAWVKTAVLPDPTVSDIDLAHSGLLGQTIGQEVTTAIGSKTSQAIMTQAMQMEEKGIVVDMKDVKSQVVQESDKTSAGWAQKQRQMFNSPVGAFGFQAPGGIGGRQ